MVPSSSKVQDGGPMIFRMFGITKHCIPQHLNPQQNQCENLKPNNAHPYGGRRMGATWLWNTRLSL